MASLRPTFSAFSEMPEALQNFFFSQEYIDADASLEQTHHLSDEQKMAVSDKIMDAVFHDIELPQMVADIKAKVVPSPVSEAQWPVFLADVLKLEIWPIRELFGDELTRLLRDQNVSTVGWPTERVMLKPLTYGGAASEIASVCGFSLMGGQMRERLRALIMSKAKGVRIDSEVRETLMRQSDFGGLGLDAETANKVIASLNSLLATAKLMSEDEYADWLAAEARKRAEPTAPTQSSTPSSEDDQEIAAIKAKMPAIAEKPKTVLEEAIQTTYAKIVNHPVDEYLDSRLRHVISSRLRDVRSQLELKQLLQRDIKVGGLGMVKDDAEAMAAQIEEGYQAYHEQILDEEKHNLDTQMEEQKQKIEERKRREAEEHAEWYREKVLARKQTEEAQKQMAEQMKKVLGSMAEATPAHPMDQKEKKAETERFGELVPAVAVGALPVGAKASQEGVSAAAKESTPPMQPTLQAPPAAAASASLARPEVKVSRATAQILSSAPPLKPRMEDVRVAAPRLMGPVQELRALTLSEFRRMAKDPSISVQKILQKLDTLQQESFERRVEGIKAFQESGLQQSYMSLVAESFRVGKPITELAEAKRAKGEDVPSPNELSAIISLNSKLHF